MKWGWVSGLFENRPAPLHRQPPPSRDERVPRSLGENQCQKIRCAGADRLPAERKRAIQNESVRKEGSACRFVKQQAEGRGETRSQKPVEQRPRKGRTHGINLGATTKERQDHTWCPDVRLLDHSRSSGPNQHCVRACQSVSAPAEVHPCLPNDKRTRSSAPAQHCTPAKW